MPDDATLAGDDSSDDDIPLLQRIHQTADRLLLVDPITTAADYAATDVNLPTSNQLDWN